MHLKFKASMRFTKIAFRRASSKYKSFESFSMNSDGYDNFNTGEHIDITPNLAMMYKKVEEKKKNESEEYLFRRFDEEFMKITPQLIKRILLKYYRILIKAVGKLFLVFIKLYQEYIFLIILYFAF